MIQTWNNVARQLGFRDMCKTVTWLSHYNQNLHQNNFHSRLSISTTDTPTHYSYKLNEHFFNAFDPHFINT